MSENGSVRGNGETSNKNSSASPESGKVWVKIEPEDEPTNKLEPVMEIEVKVEEPPAFSSHPGPADDAVQIDIKPDIKHLTENGDDEEYRVPESGAVLEQESLDRKPILVSQTCSLCDLTFHHESEYMTHVKSHEAEGSTALQCNKCQRSFSNKSNLVRHQKFCAGPQSVECTICNQTCRNAKFLQSHMTVHSTEKPYECDLCGEKYKHQSALARHRLRHTEPTKKQFPCSVCGKTFTGRHALELHMRIHTNCKPFTCAVCMRAFTHKYNMLRHMQRHDKVVQLKCEPFTCAVCMRAFTHKYNMLRHMQRHDKVVQLKCEICNKEFPLESRLKYHMRVHYMNKPYKCGLCPKSYSNVQNITSHYKKKHPDHEYIPHVTDTECAYKAWEMHKSQNTTAKEHSSNYILPEFEEPFTNNDKNDEEMLENPLQEPEMVILESNFIKSELAEEIC
ncbi:hypothetical protein NE865_07537 [Phthorimaea operculella]|nr:hypothetical protein NE865_07537 [Phthorimaea operculella]